MTDEEIREQILTKLAVPVWPVAGKALGLGHHAAKAAAKRGDIPTLPWGGKSAPVPTEWLKHVLGLKAEGAVAPTEIDYPRKTKNPIGE